MYYTMPGQVEKALALAVSEKRALLAKLEDARDKKDAIADRLREIESLPQEEASLLSGSRAPSIVWLAAAESDLEVAQSHIARADKEIDQVLKAVFQKTGVKHSSKWWDIVFYYLMVWQAL